MRNLRDEFDDFGSDFDSLLVDLGLLVGDSDGLACECADLLA